MRTATPTPGSTGLSGQHRSIQGISNIFQFLTARFARSNVSIPLPSSIRLWSVTYPFGVSSREDPTSGYENVRFCWEERNAVIACRSGRDKQNMRPLQSEILLQGVS